MPKLDYAYSDPSSFTSGQTPYGTYDADSKKEGSLHSTIFSEKRKSTSDLGERIYAG